VLAGAPLPPDWLTPSGERGAAAIGGILHNRKRLLESGIVPNQGVIPNLPADAAVEVPVMADAAGIHPISLGPLPDPIAKLLSTQVSVQQLAVEARRPRLQGNCTAGALDRSGGEFRIRRRQAARRIVGGEPPLYSGLCLNRRQVQAAGVSEPRTFALRRE
jgi:hypothetical protein